MGDILALKELLYAYGSSLYVFMFLVKSPYFFIFLGQVHTSFMFLGQVHTSSYS